MEHEDDIRTDIVTLADFKALLETNPGMVFIKFGAEWCKPCKRCELFIYEWFQKITSKTVTKVVIDIDESLEIYVFLKSKKMIQGIPAILMYKKGNTHYAFDDAVNSSVEKDIQDFFVRCTKPVV